MLCHLLQVSLNNENSAVKIPVQEFLHTKILFLHNFHDHAALYTAHT